MSYILCYNEGMDKLSYHFNKKKLPGKTPGTYLYHYPCNPADRPNFYMGGKAYAVIEVTEREWQALRELDRLEYNNTHRYLRHTTPIHYNVDEDALTSEQQEKRLDKSEPFTDLIHDRLDEERALSSLSQKQRHIVYLYKRKDMTQAEIADRLHMTTEEYIRQRFYPFLAAWRNKRITAFRKHFAKK